MSDIKEDKSSRTGLKRFLIPLNKLKDLKKEAQTSDHPEVFLFENGMRTHLFRLEALCRIYRSIIDKDYFEDILSIFKMLEDNLGEIDYYNSFINEFLNVSGFPSVIIDNLKTKKSTAFEVFKNNLIKNNFLTDENSFYEKVENKISSLSWMQDNKERKELIKFFLKQLNKLQEQYTENKFDLGDIEKGVHEFRRKLRWFSIYFTALDGLIQLRKETLSEPSLQKYMTPEILNSPFNNFPKPLENINPIYISADSYYALSWLINELGIMKDNGLKEQLIVLTEQQSGLIIEHTVKEELTKKSTYKLKEIPQLSAKFIDVFMANDKIIERLIKDLEIA